MSQNLGMSHFFQQADAVTFTILIIMTIMSCGTWFIIVSKAWKSIVQARESRRFLRDFELVKDANDAKNLVQSLIATEPFSRLVQEGVMATEIVKLGAADSDQDDFLTRSLRRRIDDDSHELEKGLSFVATVASSAPFIGLFGTVWGIYHALVAIGISGQGTLDKVAGPVGEALIMTAIGLVVAIPAAIAYNYFARTNRSIQAHLESFAHDVFALLAKGVKINYKRQA